MNVGERNRKYYEENKDKIKSRRKERYSREESVLYRAKLKDKVYSHYGRICACCGETEVLFLSVDHVNNDGAEHRRILSKGKTYKSGVDLAVLRDIIKRDFSPEFQILCMNCNWGKLRNNGVCPHKEMHK